MQYQIKAIPTTYAGVNFRSRLEARWAAFFDLCGWRWDYEPFDLDGWAPDFMLKGKTKALVEVKPIDFSDMESAAYIQARRRAGKAYRIAGMSEPPHTYEIMVIGNGPFQNEGRWCLGVMAVENWFSSEDVAGLFSGYGNRCLDYSARYGSYEYRMGGEHDGDHHLRPVISNEPEVYWRSAGNNVQWRPDDDTQSVQQIVRRASTKARAETQQRSAA